MLSLSVAFDPKKGIGYQNVMPWHLKGELKIFKENTLYKHILMGRTTYENLPKKLSDRKMIIVTKDNSYQGKYEDDKICNDLIEFCKQHQNDEEEYVICGGASIYNIAYPYIRKAYVSYVKNEYLVDTYFSSFEQDDWNVESEVDYPDFIYKVLVRK